NGGSNQVEYDVINETIIMYYDNFFSKEDEQWLESLSIQQLESYLIKHGIPLNQLLESARIKLIGSKSIKDYYAVLRVDKDDSIKVIQKEFRRLAMKYHPDKNSDNTDIYLEIQEAWDVLSDPEQRKKYDNDSKIFEV